MVSYTYINISEHCQKLLEELSERFSMSIAEVNNFAMEVVLMEFDAVKNPTGEPFSFPEQEISKPEHFVGRPEYFDPRHWRSRVPPPDAKLNLWLALKQAKFDAEIGQRLLEDCPEGLEGLEALLKVNRNCRDWCVFWSVRERDPRMRTRFAREAEEFDEIVQDLESKRDVVVSFQRASE
jgi:hypothetical protein